MSRFTVSGSGEQLLDTVHGQARLVTHVSAQPSDQPSDQPRAQILLSHGAGGGIEARDLVALAAGLPAHGFTVHLLEQPWRRAGRKIATAPPTLDAALLVAAELVQADFRGVPLVLGGRSAGARSAVRCAADAGAVAALALSFPLHPPGKPEKSRLGELTGAGVPVLVVQGERDAMGRPEEFPSDTDLVSIPGADHGFKVPARGPVTEAEAMDLVVAATHAWWARLS